jgi:hypothetical protein
VSGSLALVFLAIVIGEEGLKFGLVILKLRVRVEGRVRVKIRVEFQDRVSCIFSVWFICSLFSSDRNR